MYLDNDKKNILAHRFPDIELCYEQLNHNKVFKYDYCLAIPQGKKCFMWFTYLNDKNVCLLVEHNRNNEIERISIEMCQYLPELSLGTIFYGTIIHYNNSKFFSCEDIIYYKGYNIFKHNFKRKLSILNVIFDQELNQSPYTKNEIVIAIPIISHDKNSIMDEIKFLPYQIYNIQYRVNNNNYVLNTIYNQNRNKLPRLTFTIKPRIKSDIYELYCYSHPKQTFHDLAFIPDYKTSVYMNSIFRNIKENRSLDSLEESDDDEEFQNINDDKFVHINKTANVMCEYNYRFKKWVPIKVSNDRRIATQKDIRHALIQKS
tara:strand:- start:322 stop:1272 length:951 start_codon:yes stop_codon:yes gene_type:complete